MDYFPCLQHFMKDNEIGLTADIFSIIEGHLSELHVHFEKYFPENSDRFQWVRNPFSNDSPSDFNTAEEEELIELSSDSSLKVKFSSMKLSTFWYSVRKEFPSLSKKALKVLIPFATSYLCESGFSAVAVIKTKYRSRLCVEKEMRVAVSHLVPRFDKLCNKKQAQVSH